MHDTVRPAARTRCAAAASSARDRSSTLRPSMTRRSTTPMPSARAKALPSSRDGDTSPVIRLNVSCERRMGPTGTKDTEREPRTHEPSRRQRAQRTCLGHTTGLRLGQAGTELPQLVDQLQNRALARADVGRFPLGAVAQVLVDGGDGRTARVEIDLQLAGEVVIAGLVVLRLGHENEVAERLRAQLALLRVGERLAPLAV